MPLAELQLSLQFPEPCHRMHLPRYQVRRWICAALQTPAAEITVRIVGELEGRALNQQFRQKDYATDVLTFDYSMHPLVSADLVLCAPVIEAQALVQKLSLQAHYAHLIVHGMLHAQGHDHEQDLAAQKMQAQEILILNHLGFANPYEDRP
jgi:probable rRNA maturation factor